MSPAFEWIDVVDPSREALEALAELYRLPPSLVQDCLEPEHLPKHERAEGLEFLILRAYDEASVAEADTVRELTRKVAVFFGSGFVITIHRKPQAYLEALRARGASAGPALLAALLGAVLRTYESPLARASDRLEELETEVFCVAGAPAFHLEEGYYLKRRADVFRRMLRSTLELLPRLGSGIEATVLQDLRETGERLQQASDELSESLNTLLSLHISLASQRTNEVMRVLTIFSVFVLPLNLITGVYGMNFEHMPELKWPYGYLMALGLMASVTMLIYLGFRRKGWLKT